MWYFAVLCPLPSLPSLPALFLRNNPQSPFSAPPSPHLIITIRLHFCFFESFQQHVKSSLYLDERVFLLASADKCNQRLSRVVSTDLQCTGITNAVLVASVVCLLACLLDWLVNWLKNCYCISVLEYTSWSNKIVNGNRVIWWKKENQSSNWKQYGWQ